MTNKTINLSRLIKEARKKENLIKEKQFKAVIDLAYQKLYEVQKDVWITNAKKVDLLIKISQEENERNRELRVKEMVNKIISFSSRQPV